MRELRFVDRVGRLNDHWNASKLALHIGRREKSLTRADFAFPEFHGLRAQDQVRKIHVPRMRRRVRTYRHVADVAQVVLINHFHEISFGNAINFQRVRLINQIKLRWKAIT